MVVSMCLVLGVVGVVSAIQYQFNLAENVDNFVYEGKNLTSYFSALILMIFIQVRPHCCFDARICVVC